MGSQSVAFTIIMPALNEESVVGDQTRAILESQALCSLPLREIIVVDNGSDDHTAQIARLAGARVVHEPERGYGAACLAGALAANEADVLLFMDADSSDDLDGVASVARRLLAGEAQVSLGSRTRGAADEGALTPQQRAGNAVATLILRTLYRLQVSDLSPVKAIRRADLLALEPHERGYGWTTELLVKSARTNYRVVEAPINYHRRAGGVSKVSGNRRAAARAGFSILTTIARYARWRPNSQRATLPHAGNLLAIVAKYPQPGAVKTRLGARIGHDVAARLYCSFLQDLRERLEPAAARDGYTLWWACAPGLPSLRPIVGAGSLIVPQRGDHFAARLRNITLDAAAQGCERIVILGSDSPHVSGDVVEEAFTALDTHDVALGPADDGGYYFIALRLRPKPPDLFSGIRMSTPTVLAETLERARGSGLSVALLEATFDVDTAADLVRLRAALEADVRLAPHTLAALRALEPSAPSASRGVVESVSTWSPRS